MSYNKQILRRKDLQNDMFTDSEKEVFDLICEGYNNNRIAEELECNIQVAKTLVTSIFQKLGVSNRILAMVKYIKIFNNLSI